MGVGTDPSVLSHTTPQHMHTWSTSEKSAAILVMGVGTDPLVLSHNTPQHMHTWSTSEKSAAILVMGEGTDPSVLSHNTTHEHLVEIREECSHSGHGGGYRSLSPLTRHNT
ncbi:hypothetical protein DPMN_101904 [Dreissena polymorpha]|uniref:Uncharacterized protein n=1 Tax=Dreissena polymorpha TaxID=45954 RepID=A0A9D4LK88_DREPO|nr:hypothetical protein DPMN_101904 [Dreissena polymorpha]